MVRPLTALVAALLVVAAVATPGAATDGSVQIGVAQASTGEVTVVVTHEDVAVGNASVTVEAPNATYDGEGTYTTDADGEVVLPAPSSAVTVSVTATDGDRAGNRTVDLAAPALEVDVGQARRGIAAATVTYAITGDPAGGVAVTVTTADDNETYAGTGEYTADANGTVDLPAPEEDVTIEVVAESGNLTGATTHDLLAPSLDVDVEQDAAGNATVSVAYAITGDPAGGAEVTVSTADANHTYAGAGRYETDANGTVALPAPEENVTVDVVAESGNLTGATTARLLAVDDGTAEPRSFGDLVSAFVHSLIGDRGDHRGIGRWVSAWVVDHNPGNAPDHAGPPAAAPGSGGGPPADRGADDGGNATVANEPADAPGDDERGPPDHAGPPEDRGNGKAKGR